MKKIIILFFTMLTITAYAQTDKEKAYELAMKAIKEMEAGKIDESIELLKKSEKLDPDNINYPYEIAYSHYLGKEYKAAIKVLKGLTKHDNVNDRVWQMLGNCYDMDKKPAKAIQTYEAGIELFPKSGILHLERGNMELQKEEYNNALSYYEKGIEVEPEFPSNYYWAAKIFLSSTEEVWGILYGEIFMNLERGSARTSEISELLYKTYKSQIEFTTDTSFSVSFSKSATISISDLSDPSKMRLPFGVGVYEPTLMFSMLSEKSIDLASLNRIRTNFVGSYFDNKHHKNFPNVLFDYQRQIMKKGYLEAYNYWILMKGDEDAFATWHDNNKDKWDEFVNWFSENPIEITEKNQFHREQY